MPFCRTCGQQFQWGWCDDQWVLLEPIESHDDLDKSYMDANGTPRADHRDRHDELGASVNVVRLERRIKADVVVAEDPDPIGDDVGEQQDAQPDILVNRLLRKK